MKGILTAALLSLLVNALGCGPQERLDYESESNAHDYADNAGFEGGPGFGLPPIAAPIPALPAVPVVPALPVAPIPVITDVIPIPSLPALPPPLGAEFLPLGDVEPWNANLINSYGQLPSRVGPGPFMYSYTVRPPRW